MAEEGRKTQENILTNRIISESKNIRHVIVQSVFLRKKYTCRTKYYYTQARPYGENLNEILYLKTFSSIH